MLPWLQLTLSKKETEAPRILYSSKTAFILASKSAKSIVGAGVTFFSVGLAVVGRNVGTLEGWSEGMTVGKFVGVSVVGSRLPVVGNAVVPIEG